VASLCGSTFFSKGGPLSSSFVVPSIARDTVLSWGSSFKNPDILGGTPVFRGSRVPIQTLFDYLEGGETLEDFLEGFPAVSRESAIAALEEAKHLFLAHP
jgi:uncharacterized protein (DUF433 family)